MNQLSFGQSNFSGMAIGGTSRSDVFAVGNGILHTTGPGAVTTTPTTIPVTTTPTTVPVTTTPTTAPVGTPLAAEFSGCTAADAAPTYVQFYDTSKGNPTAWEWTFGDGSTSYDKNPLHTYASIGTFTVMLKVTDAGGATDTVIKPDCIKVGNCAVNANFSASPTTGKAPLTVQFVDLSTGPVTSRQWFFGDGGSDTVQNPAHPYNTSGPYTVTLIVDGAGCKDTETKANLITVTNDESNLGKLCGILLSSKGRQDEEQHAAVLRNFRDNRLGRDVTGSFLVTLYYTNSHEIARLFESEPELKQEFGDIVEAYAPRIGYGLLAGSTAFTGDELVRIESVLEAIAVKGSPMLKISTNFVIEKIHQQAFLLQYGIVVLP